MPILDWLNKNEAVRRAQQVPYRLLEPVPDLSYGDPASENMLIQGDNLEALKALIPLYAGQVKCIFIDPPYNTRSAFEHYDDNLEHSQWLSMMYPRLELLRDLLAEDGTIWVTIDDNEVHYLKVICDEVFGRSNFVTTLIWEKADSPRNSARQFSSDHDYILVYSKNPEWTPKKLPRTEEANSIYSNPDDDARGPWLPGDPYANKPNCGLGSGCAVLELPEKSRQPVGTTVPGKAGSGVNRKGFDVYGGQPAPLPGSMADHQPYLPA
jgi:adenine-specific DNA-methyltransferase